MKIEVSKVETQSKGKYQVAIVTYKMGTKEYTKNVVSFGDQAEVFKILTSNPTPKYYEIEEDSNSKYKNWLKVTPVAGIDVGSGTTATNPSPRSTYETPEERKVRQQYIVRQSSISSAIALLELQTKKKANEFEVIRIAETFYDYVMNGAEGVLSQELASAGDVATKLQELEDDIPF